MNFLSFLNHWFNLPYLVLLGLVAVFFVLQLLGLVGHLGDADADGHDLDGHSELDGDHPDVGDAVLSYFGIGRVPLMAIWLPFFAVSGFTGLFINRVLFVRTGSYGALFAALTAVASLIAGLASVKLFSSLAAKLVDTGGRGATSKKHLTGQLGVVASVEVSERFGEVRVRDVRGHELLLHARLAAGEPNLSRGERVVLVDYDEEREVFSVARLEQSGERVAMGGKQRV